jgi:hypothetical protein
MNELEQFYDEVALVAYGLFEERGRVHGHDMSDWLKAEMIVKKRYANRLEQKPAVAGPRSGAAPLRNNKNRKR